MARKKPTISVVVALNDKPALEGLQALTTKFLDFSGRVDPAIRVVGAGLRALTAVVGVVASTMAASTAQAMEFDKALRSVTTIADKTAFPLEKVRAISQDLANLYGGSVTEHARTLFEVISAGVTDASAATEVLYTANKLAIGGLASTGAAVAGLTGIVNAFTAQNISAAEAADSITIAAAAGATNIEQMAESLGMVAPIAAAVGLRLDEMTGAVGALTAQGIKTSVATEYLRSALTNIIKPSDQARAVAAQLGVAFNAEALAAKGLAGFLRDVVLTSGATKDQLGRLFGDVGGLTAVLGLASNNGAKLNEVLADMRTKTGATDAAFAKMSASLSFQVSRYDALREALSMSLGTAVTESESARRGLAALNDGIAQMIGYFDSAEGRAAINQFFDTILQFSAATIRAFARMAELIDSPFKALEKRWARMMDLPFVESLEEAHTGLAGLVDIAQELSGALERVAAHRIKININEDGGEGQDSGLPFGYQGRFAAFTGPSKRAGGPAPTAPEESAAARDARLAREQARAQDALAMGEAFRDTDTLNFGLAEANALAAHNEALAAQREIEAAHRAELLAIHDRYAQNMAEIDGTIAEAQARGRESLTAYIDDLSSGLEGLGDLLSGNLTEGAAQALKAIGDAVVSSFTNMVVGIADGSQTVLQGLGNFVGGLLSQMGVMLIQLGTMAVLANALSVIPILAPLVGPPGVGVAAGLAAIAGGAALVALGSAIGGAANSVGAAASAAGAGGGGGSGRTPQTFNAGRGRNFGSPGGDMLETTAGGVPSRGLGSTRGGEAVVYQTHTHLHMGPAVVVGSSPAAAGREILGMVDQAERLRGRRDPWARAA